MMRDNIYNHTEQGLELVRVESCDSPLFESCWSLYESAFPEEERREKGYHIETMQREQFHFDAVVEGDSFVGIIGWWDLDTALYIEHFAIVPTLRGGGYGGRILSLIKGISAKQVILEVEHPTDPLAQRRIVFYRREGFHLNTHHYSHPPYRGTERVNLLIMSYPDPISEEALERFKERYFPLIHFSVAICS